MKVRRTKASVVLIDCSSAAGKDDCEIAVKEQLSAKGGFPGPVPVVRSGCVSSVHDVAEAHALGASGVLLSMSEGAAEDMIKACHGISALYLCENRFSLCFAASFSLPLASAPGFINV